ncbi:hypothetical protein A3B18_00755 [Candidatus Giovannonibacteria bacterium RIFCSPLOWO2_01_FULL_46_13]|uniref:2'-5' RNA ligase n=1 Tax=Candidatus Giovannonibacteria bacterium RIFCSPLOWO2_01_FULL_46_13 TaxID=1798352 RepID=A0A1F5X3N0_9BACT|nr:MAG: hypothetical protein A3B18_00755 [Candidatus Giovannonibacteria bacterium RIFCSPLOWO2_01_FULL_46_13]
MKSSSFNIAIVPSKIVVKQAMKLSRALKPDGGLFVLNQRLYSVHVTLYMMELPLRNLPGVKRILRMIAASQRRFKLEPLIWNQDSGGYIDVSYEKTKTLSKLQETVIKELNPLREGLLRQKDIERMNIAPRSEKRNIQKYGFRSVGAQFEPHLTISRLRTYKPTATPRVDTGKMSFTAHKIGIFYLGEHGTCKKLVARFRLGTAPKRRK